MIDVIYEDNHLLAVNKPPGLLTQPSGRSGESLEEQAKVFLRDTRNKTGNVFLHAVHRLDRVASGIVLFASTDKALTRMNGLMRSQEITRIYHAVITGDLPSEQGVLTHFLRHSRLRSIPASEGEPGAKKSVLHYRILKRKTGLVLVEISLETGRYHQIRAQLSASGCPILRDRVYGSTGSPEEKGISLHHRKMEFIHPVRRTPVILEADYPPQWPF